MAGNAGKGRPKGAKNKRTIELIKKAAASDYVDPVDFLLSVVRDSAVDMDLRVRAAGVAAPYLRAKLSAIDNLPSKQSDPEPDGEGGDHELPDFRRPN